MRIYNACCVALFTRAWIEIKSVPARPFSHSVAPFTRAWIEIYQNHFIHLPLHVALFTRAWIEIPLYLIIA